MKEKIDNFTELDPKKRKLVIEDVCKTISEKYINPKVAKKIQEGLLKKYNEGFFENIVKNSTFASEVTAVIKTICKDRHLFFLYDLELLKTETILSSDNEYDKIELKKIMMEKSKETNFGFKKLEIHDANIGYLDLTKFDDSTEAFETAIAAMNFLSNTNAIIIDLRNNGGGSPDMVQLIASYFLKGFSQLNYIKRRYGEPLEQYRAMPFVPGKRMLDKRLFLLTSYNTFSAAEDFVYALKCQKRVTIIGEQTKGGGHPVDFIPIQETFLLMLPTGEAFNPICQGNWESIGIEPDIKTSADDAFNIAYTKAIEELIIKEKDLHKRLFLDLALEEHKASISKFDSNIDLQSFAGEYDNLGYGISNLLFQDNNLYWKTANSGLVKLTPISERLFIINEPGFADVSIIFEKKEKEILLHFFYKRERDILTKKKELN